MSTLFENKFQRNNNDKDYYLDRGHRTTKKKKSNNNTEKRVKGHLVYVKVLKFKVSKKL